MRVPVAICVDVGPVSFCASPRPPDVRVAERNNKMAVVRRPFSSSSLLLAVCYSRSHSQQLEIPREFTRSRLASSS